MDLKINPHQLLNWIIKIKIMKKARLIILNFINNYKILIKNMNLKNNNADKI
jgi:hypothetical protein